MSDQLRPDRELEDAASVEHVMVLGVAWFKREEWDEVKQICPDLHDTYDEWLADAEAVVDSLASLEGHQVVKTILTVDELRRWKRATGREVDGSAKSRLRQRRAGHRHPAPLARARSG
ncbi:conserved protein of unknown function [Bradyrhizobium sp. ORS 285]|nr:conserved hypothetical protein [Bradyrhizobium sp. ORS 285]SMX58777.1 conserved protein of unknown function [Bradyrhizobium sp. ORS 285]